MPDAHPAETVEEPGTSGLRARNPHSPVGRPAPNDPQDPIRSGHERPNLLLRIAGEDIASHQFETAPLHLHFRPPLRPFIGGEEFPHLFSGFDGEAPPLWMQPHLPPRRVSTRMNSRTPSRSRSSNRAPGTSSHGAITKQLTTGGTTRDELAHPASPSHRSHLHFILSFGRGRSRRIPGMAPSTIRCRKMRCFLRNPRGPAVL